MIVGGTGTFRKGRGEFTIRMEADRGDDVVLRGPAAWDGVGSGHWSVDARRSNIKSHYFLHADGEIQA